MDWIESIKEIKKAQQNNQLVVFVGAGVSRNSGVVSWGQLVEAIAQKINYQKCDNCRQKTSCTREEKCALTQDEYLRIPEYFYQEDTSEDKNDYYAFLHDTLASEKTSNPIDEEIFRILPHHIITTNYDHLLENCDAANVRLYDVVAEDKDLLSNANERYLIKMHGDISKDTTIVLREGDYIDYEQNHPLISTFIKSLLVNHTFLFIGYSLNDYNLNLIIGWINYFRKSLGVENRPTNILVDEVSASKFEARRLLDKSIAVIGLDTIPSDIFDKVKMPKKLTNPIGKKIYAYLKCVTDDKVLESYTPLKMILREKYQIFQPYNKISYEDFISVHSFGNTMFMGTELVFWEKEWYEQVASVLNENDPIIIRTFQKAEISAIHLAEDDSYQEIPKSVDEIDPLLELYQNNDYKALFEQAKAIRNCDSRRYYYDLILPSYHMDLPPYREKDFISILMHKIRCRLFGLTLFDRQEAATEEIEQLLDTAVPKYRSVVKMLTALFKSTAINEKRMQKILAEQEKRYQYHISGWISGASYQELWKLQSYAYDYYFFIIKNSIPMNYFSESKSYLSYYIQAVLCSYSPVEKDAEDGFLGIETQRDCYPIGSIELDMLVKFTNPKELLLWIRKYSVTHLDMESTDGVEKKYKNLCESFIEFKKKEWINHIVSFSIVVGLISLNVEQKRTILDSVSEILEQLSVTYNDIGFLLFEAIDWLTKSFIDDNLKQEKSRLLKSILHENIYRYIASSNEVGLSRILGRLGKDCNEEVQEKIFSQIDKIEDPIKKCNEIYLLRKVLPNTKYTDYLLEHIESIRTEHLFDLVYNEMLPYRAEILDRLCNEIAKEAEKTEKTPSVISYPNWIDVLINQCIYLKLLGKSVDFSRLSYYTKYSDPLAFLCDPNNFDYTKVNTRNVMWQNLIFSPEYSHYFIEHKSSLLSDELKKIFAQGVETKAQQKMVYGMLLDREELLRF